MVALCQIVLTDVQYKLKELILEDCNIGDKGAKCLGDALELNISLRYLDMSNNNITWRGATDFSMHLH